MTSTACNMYPQALIYNKVYEKHNECPDFANGKVFTLD